MNLDKAYRVKAKTKLGDEVMIVTSNRTRALRYHDIFLQSEGGYSDSWIELGINLFRGSNVKDLP